MTFELVRKPLNKSSRNSTKKPFNFRNKTKFSHPNSSKKKNSSFYWTKTSIISAFKLTITNNRKNSSVICMKILSASSESVKEQKIYKFKNSSNKKTNGKNSVSSEEISLKKSLLLKNKRLFSWRNCQKWGIFVTWRTPNWKRKKLSIMRIKRK